MTTYEEYYWYTIGISILVMFLVNIIYYLLRRCQQSSLKAKYSEDSVWLNYISQIFKNGLILLIIIAILSFMFITAYQEGQSYSKGRGRNSKPQNNKNKKNIKNNNMDFYILLSVLIFIVVIIPCGLLVYVKKASKDAYHYPVEVDDCCDHGEHEQRDAIPLNQLDLNKEL
jgi:membrane protein insertase Oxa1/YidC/SpoIIIJ